MRRSLASLFVLIFFSRAFAGTVEIKENQLFVDGVGQPQLYGAELQYFRLRGGSERNIPREKVIALWNQALDRMVEARMNAISFYIPWDFHEYAEGKFDFTGSVDEDGDGKPDYPSRDLFTFLRLVEEHGIRHIMVRPGPYINAEWGFLGFGAVPLWFYEKYPDSHMQDSAGLRTKLYDYSDPDFRRHAQLWLSELYRQVLSRFIGPAKPVDFVQLDNETNFMWQSLYNNDYSTASQGRYRQFLKTQYASLADLNQAHGRSWESWDKVAPPTQPRIHVAEDQDWYRFHDESIHEYLKFVRKTWEDLGVREPQILFTLAESYNAAKDGLLPNYRFRNDPHSTGMMTVNLYPKTYETPEHPLLNSPFKADHDVKAADEASDAYLGRREEWVLGPEIQGGWWRGTPVSPEARKQTFLTTLGHGLKALFIYYFNEGDNWESDWARQQVLPFFDALKMQPRYRDVPDPVLPEEFWRDLQAQVDRGVLIGIDAKNAYFQNPVDAARLYFDAPLDGEGRPGKNYELVKEIGEKLIAPYQYFLASAVEMTDPICLLKDVAQHVPSLVAGIDSVRMNSDWSGGLLGYLMQAGINPEIIHWGLSPSSRLDHCRLIVVQDNGIVSPGQIEKLKELMTKGATVLNFLDDSRSRALGFSLSQKPVLAAGPVHLESGEFDFEASASPLFSYDLSGDPRCNALLRQGSSVTGYRCRVGQGAFVQIGALFYDVFNSDSYGSLQDVAGRRAVLESLLTDLHIVPRLQIVGGGDRIVAFGRRTPHSDQFWITVKSARPTPVTFQLRINDINRAKRYRIKDLLSQTWIEMSGDVLSRTGFEVKLSESESTVYFVEESRL